MRKNKNQKNNNKKYNLLKLHAKAKIPDELDNSNIYRIIEQNNSISNLGIENPEKLLYGSIDENPKQNIFGIDLSNGKAKENLKESPSEIDLSNIQTKENSQKNQTENNLSNAKTKDNSNEFTTIFNQACSEEELNYSWSPKYENENFQYNFSPKSLFNNDNFKIPFYDSQNKEDILSFDNSEIDHFNGKEYLNKKTDREWNDNINNEPLFPRNYDLDFNEFHENSIKGEFYSFENDVYEESKNNNKEDYFNKIEISSINPNTNNNILLYNTNRAKYIKLNVYNINEFVNNNNKIKHLNCPEFIPMEKIFPYIETIVSKDFGIYDGKEDFLHYIEEGEIYNNIRSILEDNETNKLDSGKRPLQMAKKYKTFVIEQMCRVANNFKELKETNNKIKKMDKNKINEIVNSGFNLELFSKEIYAIISNDLKDEKKKKNNYDIIENIIDEYNRNGEETPLIEHLCLTYEDCLNIILYKKEDPNQRFKCKLKELIKKIYLELKLDIGIKKDYIAGFILLGYNLKKFYFGIKKRASRKKSE